MRHRLVEAVISRFPQLYWQFKANSFLTDPWQKKIFPQQRWLLKTIRRLKPDSVLEAGCGFGRNLNFLIKQGIKPEILTGTDISSRLLGKAPKKISLVKASVLSLPFPDNSFALVFTHGLLMHLNPQQVNRGLTELIRVCRKYLIIIEEVRDQPQRLNYFTWAHDYEKIVQFRPIEVFQPKTLPIKCLLIKKSSTT